jgi:nucleotide-binding universal stress UspA family protein
MVPSETASGYPIDINDDNSFGADIVYVYMCRGQDRGPEGESAMLQKKILVPLGASERSLKSVHHGLALAKRLGAQIYILQQAASTDPADPLNSTLEEALLDLINSAREAGLVLSHHVAYRNLEDEIVSMAREEGIDLLVFDADDEIGRRLLAQVKPLVASQIIQVKEKTDSDCLVHEAPQEANGIEIGHISEGWGRPGRGGDPQKGPEPTQEAKRIGVWEPCSKAFSERDPAANQPVSGKGGHHEPSFQNTRYR